MFSLTDLAALSGTDVRIDSKFETDESGALLALLGLDRMVAAEPRPARLTLAASGPLGRDLRLEGKLEAGPDRRGRASASSAVPPISRRRCRLDQFSGTFRRQQVQGRLALRTGEAARLDGTIEADASRRRPPGRGRAIDAAAPRPWKTQGGRAGPPSRSSEHAGSRRAGSSSGRSATPLLSRRRGARQLRGVARFNLAEIVFEDIAGEMGSARVPSAVTNGSEGLRPACAWR